MTDFQRLTDQWEDGIYIFSTMDWQRDERVALQYKRWFSGCFLVVTDSWYSSRLWDGQGHRGVKHPSYSVYKSTWLCMDQPTVLVAHH